MGLNRGFGVLSGGLGLRVEDGFGFREIRVSIGVLGFRVWGNRGLCRGFRV